MDSRVAQWAEGREAQQAIVTPVTRHTTGVRCRPVRSLVIAVAFKRNQCTGSKSTSADVR